MTEFGDYPHVLDARTGEPAEDQPRRLTQPAVLQMRVDGPGHTCAFETKGCTDLVSEAGGFDVHHKWPKTMGGPERQEDMLVLCPIHHRRQHSLIRAMAEHGTTVSLVKRFTKAEREAAEYAIEKWKALGQPHVDWNTPMAVRKPTTKES